MTTNTPDSTLPFDVWHPDGLVFDSSPELFVALEHQPIVFTVRGVALFAPRFKMAGFDIAEVETREHFEKALAAWMEIEQDLLLQKIASGSGSSSAHAALQAVLDGDADAFEAHIKRLEHRQRAGLTRIK